MKPAKSDLFMDKVTYLGHELSSKGIGLPESYIEKICTWPTSETSKGLVKMLGVFGYYRAFLPDFAKLTTGMNKLRNSDNFEWTKEHEENFQRLKKQFATCGVRAAPMYKGGEEFLLTIDFSGLALGAVLS